MLGVLLWTATLTTKAQNWDVRAWEEQMEKMRYFMQLIGRLYVEEPNLPKLTEVAIKKVLEELDPHSVYIPKKDVMRANESLNSGFFGIGIEFRIIEDTLVVVNPLEGGPSKKAGLLAGDRIIIVDGDTISGKKKLTTALVMKKLKGDKGTKVHIIIKRQMEEYAFDVIRDKIPIHSVVATHMVDAEVGYIKISRFALKTAEEFRAAILDLKNQGMTRLILDLRDNSGGYLGVAQEIADEFLSGQKLIVYTRTRAFGRGESLTAIRDGHFEEGRVAVLINEGSASASEIVSGAVQDWDRGIVIGRRSFGKGLVQRKFFLPDSSEVRLTVSHYYIPSGRCIQRPYEEGKRGKYRDNYLERFNSGELYSASKMLYDSSQTFFTMETGRKVYGGGGIIPDVFFPRDTSSHYGYLARLQGKVVSSFLASYSDKNRSKIKKMFPAFKDFEAKFDAEPILQKIIEEGVKKGVPRADTSMRFIKPTLLAIIKGQIASDIYGQTLFYNIYATKELDKEISEAIQLLNEEKSYNRILQKGDKRRWTVTYNKEQLRNDYKGEWVKDFFFPVRNKE